MNIKQIIKSMGEDPASCSPEVLGIIRVSVYTSAFGAAMGDVKSSENPARLALKAEKRAEEAVAHFNNVLVSHSVKQRSEEDEDDPDE